MTIINDHYIEKNPKLGFYTVGDQVFYSKPQALIEATRTGEFPQWQFNKEVFEALPEFLRKKILMSKELEEGGIPEQTQASSSVVEDADIPF